MKDFIENSVEKLMAVVELVPGGWRLRLRWWEHIHAQRHRQIRAKFIQDNCDAMPDEKWYAWFDTLTPNEFIHVMLLGDPDNPGDDTSLLGDDESTEIDEVVEAVLEKGNENTSL